MSSTLLVTLQSSFDVSGAILDMSPNSLAAHTEKLLKFKVLPLAFLPFVSASLSS